MASSTRASGEPFIPETPDNEAAVMDAFREYRQAVEHIRRTQGIPGLLAELTRINAAQQALAQRTLTSTLSLPLSETIERLDRVVPLRSPRTASPSVGSERGRGSADSRPSPLRDRLAARLTSRGLGRDAAARIVSAQVRAEARRAERGE